MWLQWEVAAKAGQCPAGTPPSATLGLVRRRGFEPLLGSLAARVAIEFPKSLLVHGKWIAPLVPMVEGRLSRGVFRRRGKTCCHGGFPIDIADTL